MEYSSKDISEKIESSSVATFDKINTRLLTATIQNTVESFLSNFIFELNDKLTRDYVVNQLRKYLDEVKKRSKIGYEVEVLPLVEEPLNWIEEVFGRLYPKHFKMEVNITLKPKQSLEKIQLNFKVN
jgi:hypothetical protein